MKVIKRDGQTIEHFDKNKIYSAIMKAMQNGSGIIKPDIAQSIADTIETTFMNTKEQLSVPEIEMLVFQQLVMKGQILTAKAYESYRAVQAFKKNYTELDCNIEGIVDGKNKSVIEENSNKNAYIASTQRDLIAGEYSKDYTRRNLLSENIMYAHDEGILHFHDADYFLEHIHNCCLVNLKDMLNNGTIINRKMIEPPKSFRVACTVATQIVQQVANGQYGGQTISIAHLAPFLRVSYYKIKKKTIAKWNKLGFKYTEEKLEQSVQQDLHEELKDGVQTIQYQINTFSTCNGQAPFLSIFIYLNEEPEYIKETAMIAEEMLKQRIIGLKNESGAYITPSFPKLLYVTDENNIHEDSEYFYLTRLAAECTSKRMVPDYISAKIMKEQYDGEVFPCMGCVDGQEIITYIYKDKMYVESFERMWERLSEDFSVLPQYGIIANPNMYMELEGVKIFDTKKGFVNTKRIIRNISKEWAVVKMSNGRMLDCTTDHPFHTNRGRVFAKDLLVGDKVTINHSQETYKSIFQLSEDYAWMQGVMLCNGSVASTPTACFAMDGEDDIIYSLKTIVDKAFEIDSKIKEQHRGVKGEYKEISMPSRKLQYELIKDFEGIAKEDRHIPNIIFSMEEDARMAFLAGMVDADGYLNSTGTINKIQLGSTNKEMALQQMALMQSLRMAAWVYPNHYDSKKPEKIRYRVECIPTDSLVQTLRCKKKRDMFTNNIRMNHSVCTTEEAEIKSVEFVSVEKYSYDVTTKSDHFEVSGIYSHNCRSFLTPWKDKNGKYKWYGRFNQGVVTINLVDAALSAEHNLDAFWDILNSRLNLCYDALMIRHNRLKDTPTSVSPIHWKYGALSRLKGDNFNELLIDGYSTISLGYAGLYECVYALIGESHTTESGKQLALMIMNHLKETCDKWRDETSIAFSLYGTPLESTTYKLANCLKKRFGVIPGVTSHDYITNSYHVNVREEISAEDKLMFEAEFQKLSSGGCVSYVETCNLSQNIDAVIQMIQFMYEHIRYAELNGKFDYCQVCDFEGEMQIDENNDWFCPCCGNKDKTKMNVARRTCGYIGDNFWNYGRTFEIKDRYVHIDNEECDL